MCDLVDLSNAFTFIPFRVDDKLVECFQVNILVIEANFKIKLP